MITFVEIIVAFFVLLIVYCLVFVNWVKNSPGDVVVKVRISAQSLRPDVKLVLKTMCENITLK